jgi:hypothetical protein
MSTSGSLLPVVLRGARPGELPVVRRPRPVVPSAQLVDDRAVTTTRLLQPWRCDRPLQHRRTALMSPKRSPAPGLLRSGKRSSARGAASALSRNLIRHREIIVLQPLRNSHSWGGPSRGHPMEWRRLGAARWVVCQECQARA